MVDTVIDACDVCGRRSVLLPPSPGDHRWLCCVCVGGAHARRMARVKPHLCPACAELDNPRFYCGPCTEAWAWTRLGDG
jgi:hypothetical protein